MRAEACTLRPYVLRQVYFTVRQRIYEVRVKTGHTALRISYYEDGLFSEAVVLHTVLHGARRRRPRDHAAHGVDAAAPAKALEVFG